MKKQRLKLPLVGANSTTTGPGSECQRATNAGFRTCFRSPQATVRRCRPGAKPAGQGQGLPIKRLRRTGIGTQVSRKRRTCARVPGVSRLHTLHAHSVPNLPNPHALGELPRSHAHPGTWWPRGRLRSRPGEAAHRRGFRCGGGGNGVGVGGVSADGAPARVEGALVPLIISWLASAASGGRAWDRPTGQSLVGPRGTTGRMYKERP